MTDQEHIDALSEPVKDALDRMHYILKANKISHVVYVNRDDVALIPKPSPKCDPVEELAAEIVSKPVTYGTAHDVAKRL